MFDAYTELNITSVGCELFLCMELLAEVYS